MADSSDNDDGASAPAEDQQEQPSKRRPQRTMGKNKAKKVSALEALKAARESGRKRLCDVGQVENVYDVVDESEYSDLVVNRRKDDWIVEDEGDYFEDGREIFDDDDDGDIGDEGGGGGGGGQLKKGRSKEVGSKNRAKIKACNKTSEDGPSSSAGKSIRNMLLKIPPKSSSSSKAQEELEGDQLLGELLGSLGKKRQQGGGPSAAIKSTAAPKPPLASTRPFFPKAVLVSSAEELARGSFHPKDRRADVVTTAASQTIEDDCTEEWSKDFDDKDALMKEFDDETNIEEVCSQANLGGADEVGGKKENLVDNVAKVEVKVEPDVEQACIKVGVKPSVATIPDVVDLPFVPSSTKGDGDKVLRFYWLDAFEEPFKHPGTVWLFGKVLSNNNYYSCCVIVRNINRHVFLLKRDFRKVKRGSRADEEQGLADVEMGDVYAEFDQKVASKYKIGEFKSKPSRMSYCGFDAGSAGVPEVADYLEVVYSAAKYPALPSELTGETFSKVFGANQSSLEQLLLSRRIKGPCWLDVKAEKCKQQQLQTSWCKLEAVCESPSDISPAAGAALSQPPPPMTILALNVKTVINPKTHQNEIVLVSGVSSREFHLDRAAPKHAFREHFCAITRPADEIWPFDFNKVLAQHNGSGACKVDKMDSERALLAFFLAKVGKLDPDIIIGHDIAGFDLDVLLHRSVQNKISHWSRLGRLKRSQPPFGGQRGRSGGEKLVMTGRLVCDLKISAKELIRCKSYDLATLAEKLLGRPAETREVLSNDSMRGCYSDSKSLIRAAGVSVHDVVDTWQCVCELNALQLALQITQVAGNVMSRTLMGGRAERNEYLLLHAFYEKGYIVPDKQYGKSSKLRLPDDEDPSDGKVGGNSKPGRNKKAAYAGGLVLEPKKGFYDKFILLMDFNSLYPSIIQEYNICFTTVSRPKSIKEAGGEEDCIPEVPHADCQPGILPNEIRKLVESRRAVKDLLKNPSLTPDQKLQYDIRQKALKLTANSMYGCLGFSFSRFYAKPLAALITSKGREILVQTKDMVEKMNLEVIYGDTDSIMINTNSSDYDQVFRLGAQIKTAVNKLYKLLELDIDGVFKYMLLLKKKKYAAVTVERRPGANAGDGPVLMETTELKGLDIVRRDWCQLAADAGKEILTYILSDLDPDERVSRVHAKLEEIAGRLQKVGDSSSINLNDLAITKQLTKDPEDYPDKKSLPHVQVALRMNSKLKGGRKLKAGDTVSYVICEDGSQLAATQRAYHIDEVKESLQGGSCSEENATAPPPAKLAVDVHYYLAQQLHPVVSRLCDPLDGTDGARIAQCLGLDPENYRRSVHAEVTKDDETFLRDEERFRQCKKFKVTCECGDVISLDSAVRGSGKDAHFALTKCSASPACKFNPLDRLTRILNALTLEIRQHIQQYYQGWIICEDPGCSGRTRQLPLVFQRAFPVCSTCRKATMYMEYSDSQLYLQLLYYQHLFDVQKVLERTGGEEKESLNRSLRTPTRIASGSDAGSEAGSAVQSYHVLKNAVDKIMRHNNYSVVSLNKVFEGFYPISAAKFRGQQSLASASGTNSGR